MKIVSVRNLNIGTGKPKICVPLVAPTPEKLKDEGSKAVLSGADLAEWRVDFFSDLSAETVLKSLRLLRKTIKDLPLLFTFRSKKEGGQADLSCEQYRALLTKASESGDVDLIDIELFCGDDIVSDLINMAHRNQVKTIVSNHDFEKTPPKEELLFRLNKMQSLGADLPKIAVMPQETKDVLSLLSATEEMHRCFADRPIITMSMSSLGTVSRISGATFGSAVTFASLDQASAPGQIAVKELRNILNILN